MSAERDREPEPRRRPDPAGLCPRCAHVKIVTSQRGSLFLLCLLSAADPRFPKYPPQPVVSCEGFEGQLQGVEPLVTVPGSLLAAAPNMLDPNFMHAVVLMCRHSEEGAFGFVVNRPASVTLDVLAPSHPRLKDRRFPIFTGGPVGLDTLQFLHRAGAQIPGGVEIETGLWLGGEIDALAAYLEANPETAPRNVRLLVGYSGWGAGQLEGELATGSWLPAALEADWVFGDDGQTTWRSVLKSLGGQASGLADLPPDPSWN